MNTPLIIYSPLHKKHNPPLEIYDGVFEKYAEKPERVENILSDLKKNKIGEIIAPKKFPDAYIRKIHHHAYVDYLKRRCEKIEKDDVLYPSFFITDTYAPVVKSTYDAAAEAVNVALTGAGEILGEKNLAYSLCRPPGHHSESSSMGGYCYFNNAAIVAEFLSEKGKVAILDVDFHHGNGTQQAFYERDDILYVSIHADPLRRYPYKTGFSDENGKGKGRGYNKNYPLEIGTGDGEYFPILEKAVRVIIDFKPKFLVVSLGFDTYEKDPIGGFKLTIPFYEKMGQEIKKINSPTLIVQEGGYFIDDLGKMAISFLRGIS